MNDTVMSLYDGYLRRIGDKAAAASLALAEVTLTEQSEPKAAPTNGLLNFKQAAAYLGYTEHGLRKIVNRTQRSREGQHTTGATIEFCQSGRKGTLFFRREWLDQFIESHRVRPGMPSRPQVRKRSASSTRPETMDEIGRKAAKWKALCRQ